MCQIFGKLSCQRQFTLKRPIYTRIREAFQKPNKIVSTIVRIIIEDLLLLSYSMKAFYFVKSVLHTLHCLYKMSSLYDTMFNIT